MRSSQYIYDAGASGRRGRVTLGATTNHGQLERTLAELRGAGRIDRIDAAVVQALKSMAKALDKDPANAALWRQYLAALRELTADDDDGPPDPGELYGEVGDAPPS
jgi:hypothetical protein